MDIIKQAADYISSKLGNADMGIILGSGLSGISGDFSKEDAVEYSSIPGFVRPSVHGHDGICARVEMRSGKTALVFRGRFHGYEGLPQNTINLPVRTMSMMGIKTLIVTNAAGGVNADFVPGDFMLITDHINLTGKNPLTGPNDARFGTRFPDMTNAYDREYIKNAQALFPGIKTGVYACMNGPSFETPAEINMLRIIGADAVGMSTVPEVILARHGGMRVLGISCITNMAAGMTGQALTHEEVNQTVAQVGEEFSRMLTMLIDNI